MPNVKILTSDEIDYDIKDEKGRLGTAAEFSTSSNYVIGDYCWYDNKLYRFTANHSSSSWTAAHATEVKVTDEIKNIDIETDTTLSISGKPADAKATGDEITELKNDITQISEITSVNLLPVGGVTEVVNGVTCTYSNGTLKRYGTATSDGGRLTKLTPVFTLSAGTYTFWIETSGATLFVESASNNTVIATAVHTSAATFTLSAETSLFIGTNFSNNTTYNDSHRIQLEKGSEKSEYQLPSQKTAYDKIARGEIAPFLDLIDTSVNLLPKTEKTATVNGISCNYVNGHITRSGTATGDGGRLNPLTDYFDLPAGTYTFWSYPTGATFVIEKQSDNTIVAIAINDVPTTFTINDALKVYVGMTVANGTTYNDAYDLQIQKGSEKTPFEEPSYLSVIDGSARKTADIAHDMDVNNAFAAFRKFGVIGDSLAVGYIGDGAAERNPEYSWGRILARRLGNICQLFAKAGATTKSWFADQYCYAEAIKSQNICQAYIIGIGTNDIINSSFPVGTTADINLSDSSQNADSFCGWYGKIIQTIKSLNASAKIFVFTMPYPRAEPDKNDAIRSIAALFTNVYVVDLEADYNDMFISGEITAFIYSGHYSPGGYANLALLNNYVLSVAMKENASEFVSIPSIPYGNGTDVV